MTLKPFYDRTEDVHVGAYIAYGHTDGKLYADAEHKVKVSAADLGRAFMLGRLIICDNKNYFAPIAYAEATGVKTYDGTAYSYAWQYDVPSSSSGGVNLAGFLKKSK